MTRPPSCTERRPDPRSAPGRRTRIRAAATAVAVAGAVILAACGEPEAVPEPPITREQFIEAVVAIRNAERAVEDMDSADARFEARRDSILESLSLTEADLQGFLNAHQDLGYMEAVWDSVTQQLKRPLDDVGARGRTRFQEGREDDR